jgi:hypothetical protein
MNDVRQRRGRGGFAGPIQAVLAKRHGGSIVAAGIAAVALVLVTAGFLHNFDWVRSWRVIGFPGALPPFYDLHVVTDNAARCADATGYPYLHAACDPWATGYNYPPIWLLLGKLGIDGGSTPLLATLFELPALLLFAFLLRGYSVRSGLMALALMLSPSVVLGFERGNIDIAEWILVCGAALLFSEHSALRAAGALALLCLAVVIKFLAVFCCTLFVRLRPRSMVVAGLLAGFSLVYLYSLADVLQVIRQETPISPYVSYGYPILFDRLEFLYGPRLGLDLSGLTHSWIPIITITLVILAALAAAVVIWHRGRAFCRLSEGSAGVAFLFGSGVFCGSFLLLNTNYTYRLMFLLLCLPQLFDWIEERSAAGNNSRRAAYLLYVCCLVSMWLKFHPERTLHVNQLADWILFGMLVMLGALNALYALAALIAARAAPRTPAPAVTSP